MLLVGDTTENADAPGSLSQSAVCPEVLRVKPAAALGARGGLARGGHVAPPAAAGRRGAPDLPGQRGASHLRRRSGEGARQRRPAPRAEPGSEPHRVGQAPRVRDPDARDRPRAGDGVAGHVACGPPALSRGPGPLCGGEASLSILAGGLQTTPESLSPALVDLAERGWITMSDAGRGALHSLAADPRRVGGARPAARLPAPRARGAAHRPRGR